MLHLKHNPLARRQMLHGNRNPLLYFSAEIAPLRIECRPMFPLPLEEIRNPFFVMCRSTLGSLIFRTRLPPAQMIQADVRYDPIQPGVEAALEAKPVQIPINLKKGFLLDVPAIIRPFL